MQLRGFGLLVLAVFLAAGCDKDTNGTGGSGGGTPVAPSVSGLVGNWKASKAEFVNIANSSQRMEVVSLGTTLTLTLNSDGSYAQKIVDPGQSGQTTAGTWTSTTDTLSLRPAGMSWSIEFDASLSGSTLTLSGGHVEFDVNQDGKDEETLASLTMIRQ